MALYSAENLAAYREVVRGLDEHLERRGIDYFVMTLPGPSAVLDPPHQRFSRVLQVFNDLQVPCLDLQPSFLERIGGYDARRVRSELWANPVNAHPGQPITEFYATMALEYIQARGMLPLR